ncbi:MAG: radical SAM protein [Desulfobacteraceae bacterium]|nr:MAG: radical SAM protein [Desulfobacteraceae bacterium]
MMKLALLPTGTSRKRVLIVNCYFDDMRLPVGRRTKIPQAMGPVYLAGAFSPHTCDIRLYSEMYSGPLEDEKLLSWPDMLVLTGLSNSFDRMLHLTAYARTKNRHVIVVAGGPAVRALPTLARRHFDLVCTGDVEELIPVAEETFGKEAGNPSMQPRYDLAYWMGPYGYVESSRYCNFRCSFCSLTGENRNYRKYDLDFVRRQITTLGKGRQTIIFIDNNFYGNDRSYFLARMELIRELRQEGYIRNWSALVTNDFFHNDENLLLAKEAGCIALFSGVESFDRGWLRKQRKNQNTGMGQVEMIRKCTEHGILFLYGLMLDVARRRVSDLRREIEFILGSHQISLPSYLSIVTPFPGTPHFYDCLAEKRILPNTRLRDLDTTTLSLAPLDAVQEATRFIFEIQTLRGYKGKVLRHGLGFFREYRSALTVFQMAVALGNSAMVALQKTPNRSLHLSFLQSRNRARTHVSTTEPLDRMYTPAFRVDSRFESYFRPTFLTDGEGYLSAPVEEDLLGAGVRRISKVEAAL